MLICPLQNVALLVVEEFALRTGVHMPWPQLERLADEIARSVERKVRFTHDHFFAKRNRSSTDRDVDLDMFECIEALSRLVDDEDEDMTEERQVTADDAGDRSEAVAGRAQDEPRRAA